MSNFYENLKDKMEIIAEAYTQSLDLDLALQAVVMSDEELDLINKDEAFVRRLVAIDIKHKQGMIQSLMKLANPKINTSASVQLEAIKLLGKLTWRDKFVGDDNNRGEDASVEKYKYEVPDNGRTNAP